MQPMPGRSPTGKRKQNQNSLSCQVKRPGRLLDITMTNFLQTSRPRSTQEGQSLVEFALVLIFIILPVTFVLIDGAITLYMLSNATNAAREGAHAGSIYQTSTSQVANQTYGDYVQQIDTGRGAYIQQEVDALLGPLVGANAACTTSIQYSTSDPYPDPQPVDCPEICPNVGNPFRELDGVTVTVACPRRLLFGLVNAGVITLTGEATMKIEPGGVQGSP